MLLDVTSRRYQLLLGKYLANVDLMDYTKTLISDKSLIDQLVDIVILFKKSYIL
jgi:uncharacterized protein YjgD (DUF1641 family)